MGTLVGGLEFRVGDGQFGALGGVFAASLMVTMKFISNLRCQ